MLPQHNNTPYTHAPLLSLETHPSSPLKVMLSLFFCSSFTSVFMTCSYASSSMWSLRMLYLILEPCTKPSRAIIILKFCSLVGKASFLLCRVVRPDISLDESPSGVGSGVGSGGGTNVSGRRWKDTMLKNERAGRSYKRAIH